MSLSRIGIQNFRNFSNLDVSLSGDIVIVGENRVGKSNFLYALRLLFDPSLPDSARQLGIADFWEGVDQPALDDKIVNDGAFGTFTFDVGARSIQLEYNERVMETEYSEHVF